MTGVAYATSAEMARELGRLPRLSTPTATRCCGSSATTAAPPTARPRATRGSPIAPVPLDHAPLPRRRARRGRATRLGRALALGEQHGFRNAQVTVIAPTGTIGLVMDCDTTGIEPDFALVKFKKLAGGGYFKIINQTVPAALATLGYARERDRRRSSPMPSATARWSGAPGDQPRDAARPRASTTTTLGARSRRRSPTAFDISFAFNRWTLGRRLPARETLGLDDAQLDDPGFDLLAHLGFSRAEIEAANAHVCGTMTLEGAPHLKAEHLPVFDCANPCGAHRHALPRRSRATSA